MIPLIDETRADASVAGVLAAVHERWMEQITEFLAPALSEEADFWSRWTSARFLDDQFGDRFRLECALLDALAPLLPADTAGTIAKARAGVEQTADELTAAGRRRATGVLTAHLGRRFIDQLALWCIEVELATARVRTAELPRVATRLLTRLRAATLWR
jgi:hypothetical protein